MAYFGELYPFVYFNYNKVRQCKEGLASGSDCGKLYNECAIDTVFLLFADVHRASGSP